MKKLPVSRTALVLLSSLVLAHPVHAALVAQALEADIADSGREFTDIQLWQSRTCLLRSVQTSLGFEPPKPEGV